MMQFKQNQTLLMASLLSWALLFTLPFANSQFKSDVDWVKLCTSMGIQLVAIDSSSSKPETLVQNQDCSCVETDLLQLKELLPTLALDSDLTGLQSFEIYLPSTAYFLPPSRAPPTV